MHLQWRFHQKIIYFAQSWVLTNPVDWFDQYLCIWKVDGWLVDWLIDWWVINYFIIIKLYLNNGKNEWFFSLAIKSAYYLIYTRCIRIHTGVIKGSGGINWVFKKKEGIFSCFNLLIYLGGNWYIMYRNRGIFFFLFFFKYNKHFLVLFLYFPRQQVCLIRL